MNYSPKLLKTIGVFSFIILLTGCTNSQESSQPEPNTNQPRKNSSNALWESPKTDHSETGYVLENNKIFYQFPDSPDLTKDGYPKMYRFEVPIKDGKADTATFSVSKKNPRYAKDKNFVYLMYKDPIIIKDADPTSFEVLDHDYSKDANTVYYDYHPLSLENADKETFEVINEYFLKDKNTVYYRRPNNSSEQAQIITQSDPATFQVIKDQYAQDKNSVYWQEQKISADQKTFQVLGEKYSADKDNIYFETKKIDGADVKTFEILKGENSSAGIYSKDHKNVYKAGLKILNADPATFEVLDYPYTKDKRNVYWHQEIISQADPNTFQIFPLIRSDGHQYAKDKQNVYWQNKKISEADAATFEITQNGQAKDKYRIYQYHEQITEIPALD